MLRKFTFLFVALTAILACSASAQNWKFVKVFPDSNFTNSGNLGINNAITVDPMGRVWVGSNGTVDSLLQSGGTYLKVGAVIVFNPDGSQASFSPIKIFTGSWGSDSVSSGTAYGMCTGPDGNIYVEKPSSRIYKLNYKDGTGMQKIVSPIPGYTSSLASLAIDDAGEVFLQPVVPTTGVGVVAIAADFSSVVATVDTSTYGQYARTIAVSGDGNDVFVPSFTGKYTLYYNSPSGTLGAYTLVDTLFKGGAVESMGWDPRTHYLWASMGNTANTGLDPATSGYSQYTWYAFDMTNPSTPVMKDSITWKGLTNDSTIDLRPRGIAFSPTGDTVYVAEFDITNYAIQMWTRTATAVNEKPHAIPSEYSLSQNYPNPFNPTTRIDFTLKATGKVTLKVYDVLGREVATLINGVQTAGPHAVTFNASNLPSGVYIYTLITSDGAKLTKKMVLTK